MYKRQLIGREGDGFKMIMQTLDVGRLGVGAIGLGIAEGCLLYTSLYGKRILTEGKNED